MIEIQGLTKHYGSVRAVDDVTFEIKPGVVTGFLGPNGAGKSTTMRMILGLDRPTAGRALIDGVPYGELRNPLTKVGALLDAKAVHPNRSARNHLKWMAQSNGLPLSRVDEVLGIVGLDGVAGKKAGGFSLGMGQRLGLAAALLGDPEVLLLDEPVNGLDPEGIRWVRSLVKALAAEGRSVLISSHLLSEMALTADQLVVIGRGRLIADMPTYDFVKQYSGSSVIVRAEHLDAFAGTLSAEGIGYERGADEENRPTLIVPDQTTESIGRLAFSVGVALDELSLRRASLEDAFMELTRDDVQYQSRPAGNQGGHHAR